MNDPIAILTDLGFNQLEAEIYTHLLQSEPMTPYKVAQAVGRQTANVYKAVEILARRGAVMIEEGESRLCRAVPVKEFLRHTEREFLGKTKNAAAVLSAIDKPSFDERVYRIESVAEVVERVKTMLEREATDVAVVDAFPSAFAAIRPSIEKAIARGVKVFVQTYEPTDLRGATSVVAARPAADVLEFWRSEQLNVVIDGRQSLVALMAPQLERVYQAIWSNSLYLATLLHAGMRSEHTIHQLLHMVDAKRSPEAIARAVKAHRFLLDSRLPGQEELLARFRGEKRASRKKK